MSPLICRREKDSLQPRSTTGVPLERALVPFCVWLVTPGLQFVYVTKGSEAYFMEMRKTSTKLHKEVCNYFHKVWGTCLMLEAFGGAPRPYSRPFHHPQNACNYRYNCNQVCPVAFSPIPRLPKTSEPKYIGCKCAVDRCGMAGVDLGHVSTLLSLSKIHVDLPIWKQHISRHKTGGGKAHIETGVLELESPV